ncbi:hypothetical protein [Microbacterium sp. MYb62]|uniref:hypothetical protein n=1 Tax=Microbacterium sp. MYb62 TaxID=1848690 RepID=UPI000CFBAC39|nr:hypothetical protein [Microbacterium sp. MYb62]PRB13303.1 hypothetical protein CQ042_13805 [Microbacterium sp. MYb62]
MMLTDAVARGVASGSVTLAFRRWSRARVRPGDRFLSSAGIIEIVSIAETAAARITEDDARAAGVRTTASLLSTFRGQATDPVFRIGLAWVGPDPRIALAEDAELADADREEIDARLAGLDRSSAVGAWTRGALESIRDHPGVPAEALRGDLPKDVFKRSIRKLKELGLTRSLTIGYELSPRGHAYLRGPGAAGDAG